MARFLYKLHDSRFQFIWSWEEDGNNEKMIKKSNKCAGLCLIREVLKAKEISNHHLKPLKAIWSIEQQNLANFHS